MDNNGKVLFNEKCSICNFEIKHYKKRSHLTFDDCSHMEDKYLKKLHVVFDDEKELVGVDAFIYIWKRTKGYGWLGNLLAFRLSNNALFLLIQFWLFYYFGALKYLIVHENSFM